MKPPDPVKPQTLVGWARSSSRHHRHDQIEIDREGLAAGESMIPGLERTVHAGSSSLKDISLVGQVLGDDRQIHGLEIAGLRTPKP